ncbi:MAG: hypothetical protein P1V20_02775, partial [Verrucomicrobiales bacterium]|nr:hypothetical protein [Verrucomicrobiales bacterium]
ALGLVGYFAWETIGAGSQSKTALIPSVIGVLMMVGGLIAIKKHALGAHISVLFAFLGALAGLGRLVPQIIKGNFTLGGSSLLILLMTVICLFYTVMAIRSFKAARKAQA